MSPSFNTIGISIVTEWTKFNSVEYCILYVVAIAGVWGNTDCVLNPYKSTNGWVQVISNLLDTCCEDRATKGETGR